jgi:hypothetical protein
VSWPQPFVSHRSSQQAAAASAEHPWNAHALVLHAAYDDAHQYDASTATSDVAAAGAEYAEYGRWRTVPNSASTSSCCAPPHAVAIASTDDVPTADDADAASGYG